MTHRAVLLTSFIMLSLHFSACSGKDAKVSVAPQESDGPLNVADVIAKTSWKANLYNNASGTAHTGFDGANLFKVLIGVSIDPEFPNFDKLSEEQLIQIYDSPEYLKALDTEWKKVSLDADAAFFKVISEVETFAHVYELTTLKAGTTTVKVKFVEQEIPIAVQIASYTAAQVAAGRQRYATAVTGAAPSPACASCHRAEGGADHSPYLMSQYSDRSLLSFIETGVNSDNKYEAMEPHKLTFASAADKEGIVPYLRSLNPGNGETAAR